MADHLNFPLTSDITVGQLTEWMTVKSEDAKIKLIDFIRHCIENRFLKHVRGSDSGYLIMSIGCFAIETLQSYKEGVVDSRNQSKDLFIKFFAEETTRFPGFAPAAIKFYENVRCGILHLGETKQAWRIVLANYPLLNSTERTINANLFLEAVSGSLNDYLEKLKEKRFTEPLWLLAFDKLKYICDNCKQ